MHARILLSNLRGPVPQRIKTEGSYNLFKGVFPIAIAIATPKES